MQFRVIVVTDPQTNKQPQTHRQDRLQYTAPQLAHSVTTRGNMKDCLVGAIW